MGYVVGNIPFVYEFSFISIVFFIYTQEYARRKIYILANRINNLCMGFNALPSLVVSDKLLLRYESFCRYPTFFRITLMGWGKLFLASLHGQVCLVFNDYFIRN